MAILGVGQWAEFLERFQVYIVTRTRQALVCVIVVNYNSGQFLKNCVDALKRQTFTDFETIIVDNGSADKSLDWIGETPDNLRIHRMGENAGFARANNVAATMTEADWIATLNADAFPDAHWLEKLMKAAGRHPEVVMFGSTLVNAERVDILDGTGDVFHILGIPWRGNLGASISNIPPEGETFAPCAAAALFQRDWFIKAGGFDERFFCYMEDTDLAYRLRLMGHRCVQTPDSVALHMGSALSGGRYGDFSQFHGVRNRIWLYVKNTPLPLLIVTLPFFILVNMALLLRAAMRGYGKPVIRGIWASIIGIGPILKSRGEVQRSATAGFISIAMAMTWSPIKLFTRESDVRPL
jgi:GT2 family glycosyltransferase